MITKLAIQNKASYDSTGVVFSPGTNNYFVNLNIVYGANGSGKSTLVGEIVRHFKNQGVLSSSEFTWNDKDKENLLVFDENFVKERFVTNRTQQNGITYGLIDNTSPAWTEAENNLRDFARMKRDTEGMSFCSNNPHNYSKLIQQILFNDNISSEIIDYYKSKGMLSLYDFFKFEYDLFIKKESARDEDIKKYLDNYLSSGVANDNPFFVKLVDYNKTIISITQKLFYVTIPCFILHFFVVEHYSQISSADNRLLSCQELFTNGFDDNKLCSILDEYTKKRIEAIEKQIIAEKRKKIRDVSEVVDKINTQLRYYNYSSFYIEADVTDTDIIPKFKLKRTGVKDANVFESLSEAEKHFIAFLYFYHLCLGYDTFDKAVAQKKKVIIFDDPVTSMDSNTLFVVSQMLCELFRKADNDKNAFANSQISQGFVLTHNSYFFKEFDYRKKNKCISNNKVSRLYREIEGDKYVTKIEFDYKYKDDYALMWDNLKAIKQQGNQDKSMNVIIGNLCRRILESYAKFIGLIDYTDNSLSTLIPKLKAEGKTISPHEEVLFNAFIAMINTDSHFYSTSEDVYYQAVSDVNTSQIYDVFEQLFNVINADHYKWKMA